MPLKTSFFFRTASPVGNIISKFMQVDILYTISIVTYLETINTGTDAKSYYIVYKLSNALVATIRFHSNLTPCFITVIHNEGHPFQLQLSPENV